MSCCSAVQIAETNAARCPRCDEKGKGISLATVGSMAERAVAAEKLGQAAYKLCRNVGCPVVYFAPGIAIEKNELRVPVNFKERSCDGPVCYCFDHTVADIKAEPRSEGRSTATAMITAEVKAGHCACEVKNPAGACCLGDVTRAVQAVLAQLKRK